MSELQNTIMPDGEIRKMAQEPQSPWLGRVVLFTPQEGEPHANGAPEYVAIIGQVWADPGNPRPFVNLLVFPPYSEPRWEGSVQESDGVNTSRTWRWPPRVLADETAAAIKPGIFGASTAS